MTRSSEQNNQAVKHAAIDTGDWGRYAPSAFAETIRGFTASRSEGFVGKRMAFLARRLGLMTMGSEIDVEVFGHRMRIQPGANLAEKRMLFTPQYFDPQERALLARVLPRDAVFVDVGANVGAYSFFVASCTGPEARIIAIEPQPSVFDRLTANVGYNKGVPIEPIALAIADVDGEVQLFLDRHNAGETGIRRLAGADGSESLTVRAKPLALLVAELDLPRIDAMKVDVEGAEDLILVPFFAEAPQDRWPSVLILENSPESWQTNCIDLAIERGYEQVLETRLNVVLTRQATI
ncbi:MAG: FkbM family methyltransferase [Devosiaceae bacterium]|nr:FkbM family methyltransferase [Devosiaceae bacterium MH13]